MDTIIVIGYNQEVLWSSVAALMFISEPLMLLQEKKDKGKGVHNSGMWLFDPVNILVGFSESSSFFVIFSVTKGDSRPEGIRMWIEYSCQTHFSQ